MLVPKLLYVFQRRRLLLPWGSAPALGVKLAYTTALLRPQPA